MYRIHQSVVPVAAVLLAGGAWYARAGDLNPPAGPVTGTMKTLVEVEPRIAINATNTPGDADSLFKITQRGSYYLTGNIAGVAAKHGIEIVASGVTLDLNGFDLVGVAASLDGVSVSVFPLTNIAVVNGSVRNWGDEGVDLGTFSANTCRVEGVLASGNAGNGILTGSGCTVSNCTAYLNTANGIGAGAGCTVSNCSTRANTFDGIVCSSSCVIRDNTCTSNGNGAGDGAGIHATSNANRIERNNCTDADRGIDVDVFGNIIVRNTCSGNTTNWDIVANNVYGPIIDRTAPASPAVSGNSAASSLGSTDPNANFTY